MSCKVNHPTCQCLTCKKGESQECCELDEHMEMDCPITKCTDYEPEDTDDA